MGIQKTTRPMPPVAIAGVLGALLLLLGLFGYLYLRQKTEDLPAIVLAADRAIQEGRYADALPLYREAARRGDANPEVLKGLAVAANVENLPDEALAAMARLPASERSGYWPLRITGDAYFRKGEFAVARTWLLAADLASPGAPDVAAVLAMVGEELADHESATRWWQRYLERAPEGPFRDRACAWLEADGDTGDCVK